MAAKKKDAVSSSREDSYAKGYSDCARHVKRKLDELWHHKTRAIRPDPFMEWLKAMAESKPPPAPLGADSEVNAKVEGEDVFSDA